MSTYLVTGGAGFIGSQFVDLLIENGHRVVVLDRLTYAGHLENLAENFDTIDFVQGDIGDRKLLTSLFERYAFNGVINFAAESHVDRSIENAADFVTTNVVGVFSLLDASLRYWERASTDVSAHFRFIQISTDEVFGSLGETGYFSETTPYAPNSPYSASKAASDHFARAWFHTYQMPVIVTNCSNNFGPRQFPEKLIPHTILCAITGKQLPVYGDGRNVRDWIYVGDHCRGVYLALQHGRPGEHYCFGGRSERRNIEVVQAICDELDRVQPKLHGSYRDQITFVADRKGHDWRYAIDDSKSEREIGFRREHATFEEGLRATVQWYLRNQDWMRKVMR